MTSELAAQLRAQRERYDRVLELLPKELGSLADALSNGAPDDCPELRAWRQRQEQKEARRHSTARQVPERVRTAVLSSGPCAYCGNEFPTEVDHIVPVSRGGTRRRTNLTPACWDCNEEKRDSTPEEWRACRIAAGLCWPPLSPRLKLAWLQIGYMERVSAGDPVEDGLGERLGIVAVD